MIKNILRVFFVVLIVVGGIWWWKSWKVKNGMLTPEATQIEKEVVSSPTPEPTGSDLVGEEEKHEPVEAGVGDWQLVWVMVGSLGVGMLMWGLYRASYRVYWLG